MRAGPVDEDRRHLRVDQVIGQADGDAKDDEHTADHRHALGDHAQQVSPK